MKNKYQDEPKFFARSRSPLAGVEHEKFRVNSLNGYTLVEVMVSGFILIILAFLIARLLYTINQNQLQVFQQYNNVDQANENVQLFIKEVRTARDGDNGAFVIEQANDQSIVFYSDIDFDGITEKVRYFLNGTNFYKGVIKATGYPITYPQAQEKVTLLANNVRNASSPIFYYYNSNWPQDTQNNPLIFNQRLSNAKLVKIYLKINSVSDPKSDFVTESYAQIRTLKDNL